MPLMSKTLEASEVADRISDAISGNDNHLDVFNGLIDAYAFQMSLLTCPDCRKQAAHALKQCIPQMLAHANKMAAEWAKARPPRPPSHAYKCH
jgi:hypothetical protein